MNPQNRMLLCIIILLHLKSRHNTWPRRLATTRIQHWDKTPDSDNCKCCAAQPTGKKTSKVSFAVILNCQVSHEPTFARKKNLPVLGRLCLAGRNWTRRALGVPQAQSCGTPTMSKETWEISKETYLRDCESKQTNPRDCETANVSTKWLEESQNRLGKSKKTCSRDQVTLAEEAGRLRNVKKDMERWGAGVETQKNVRGEIGGWGRVPFNEPYAPSLSTIYDGA